MEITQEQDAFIAPGLPVSRGNVGSSKRHVRNAFVSVVAHGGNWRGLPQSFANWHTIATRINRCAKAGVRDRIVATRQQARILRLRIAAVSRDSIDSEVHSDGTEALKKGTQSLEPSSGGWTTKWHRNGIGLARRRERAWHSVYRQAILMMRPVGGDECSIVAQ